MANQKELKEISKSRLKAGKTLLDSGDYDGAVYMLGYALECCFKSVICKRLNFSKYPDSGKLQDIFKTHKFDILLALSGLENNFNIAFSPRLSENWSELTKWNPEMRYQPIGSWTKDAASRMYEALSEKPEGVITWITKHRKW